MFTFTFKGGRDEQSFIREKKVGGGGERREQKCSYALICSWSCWEEGRLGRWGGGGSLATDSRLQEGRRWVGSRCGCVSVDTYWEEWPDRPAQRRGYTPECQCLNFKKPENCFRQQCHS